MEAMRPLPPWSFRISGEAFGTLPCLVPERDGRARSSGLKPQELENRGSPICENVALDTYIEKIYNVI